MQVSSFPGPQHEQDKLASAIAFADRTVRERAGEPPPERSLRVALLLHYEDDSGCVGRGPLSVAVRARWSP